MTTRCMFTVAATCIRGSARARLAAACASSSWLYHEFGSWMVYSSGGQSFVVDDVFKVNKGFALDGTDALVFAAGRSWCSRLRSWLRCCSWVAGGRGGPCRASNGYVAGGAAGWPDQDRLRVCLSVQCRKRRFSRTFACPACSVRGRCVWHRLSLAAKRIY